MTSLFALPLPLLSSARPPEHCCARRSSAVRAKLPAIFVLRCCGECVGVERARLCVSFANWGSQRPSLCLRSIATANLQRNFISMRWLWLRL